MPREQVENENAAPGPFYEVLTAQELAQRWHVPVTWIREQTRARCPDPIPHVRLGRYVRFQFGSPALARWWQRREVGGTKTRLH